MIKELTRSGRTVPSEVLNKPKLEPKNDFYIRAFFELSTDRQSGFSVGYIPFSTLLRYCEYMEMQKDYWYSFVNIMRRVDQHYVSMIGDKDG